MLIEHCQRILDGKGMPANSATSVVILIFKGKGDIIDCSMYRCVKLLEHAMQIVEKVLERTLSKAVTINELHFGFMPGKGTIDAIFVLRRIQEEYLANQRKSYMCSIDLE